MNDNNMKSTCNHCSLSSTNSARRLQTEHHSSCEVQPPATIREPQLLMDYTYRSQTIHAGAVTCHQCRASQTPAGP